MKLFLLCSCVIIQVAEGALCDVIQNQACTPPPGTQPLKSFTSLDSAAACCAQCEAYAGCTGWSWRQAKDSFPGASTDRATVGSPMSSRRRSHKNHPCFLYADCSLKHADEHYTCGAGASSPPSPALPTPAPTPAPPVPTPAPAPTPSSSPPLPTKGQLSYVLGEIVALTHFNMRTFLGYNVKCSSDNWLTGVKSSDPATFAPSQLNVSNWVDSYRALGVKSAVLTFKHDCGFLLFDTNTTLPNGTRYPYGVMRHGVRVDVAREWLAAVRAAGMKTGIYYSLSNNYFLNRHDFKPKEKKPLAGQVDVSDAQYVSLILAQLREIWCGMGEMHELWFDGGIDASLPGLAGNVSMLLKECQPDAATFTGYPFAPNPIRYVGGEDGLPSSPLWSTGCEVTRPVAHGDPDSTVFCPCGCDTKLQSTAWFWDDKGIRAGSDLINVYHSTVGSNGVLELDFAIDKRGMVDDAQAHTYAKFGQWIRDCYGPGVAVADANATAGQEVALTLPLQLPANVSVDRFWVQEDIAQGQRVRAFTISGQAVAGGPWKVLASGTSIGNKAIILLRDGAVMLHAANLTISQATHPPIIKSFAAFKPCPDSF